MANRTIENRLTYMTLHFLKFANTRDFVLEVRGNLACSYHPLSLGVREAHLLSTCRHKEPLHEISLQLPLRSLMKTNTGWKNMILISVHILCFGLFGGPILKGNYIAFFETFLKIDHIIRVTSKPKM